MTATVGIRREDKNEWERRVPLTPDHVRLLRSQGLDVVVQPSAIRVFHDEEYASAGARIQDDLSSCGAVFGVKEMPVGTFSAGQAFMFFSHVIKGQPYNMPMLRNILDQRATLIDYERVTDDTRKRLIFFGNFAGIAGMLETLHTYGKRMEWEGIPNPFAALKRPLDYSSLEEARSHLREVGLRIAEEGVPPALHPLVVGFTGYGNVSRGAQSIFHLIPFDTLTPDELVARTAAGDLPRDRAYKVEFHEKHMVRPRESDHTFELQDYYANPSKYEGVFESYLPCLSILVNGIYWEERFPRLVTLDWLRSAWSAPEVPKLRVIGDISCDINGSVECTVKGADPGHPVFTWIPETGEAVDGWEGRGPAIMAVDTLPAELPREASASFGDMLLRFVPAIAGTRFDQPYSALTLPWPIRRAVIAHQGELTPDYAYLRDALSSNGGLS